MKKIIHILSLVLTTSGYSQIVSNNVIASTITNSNVLLDGSTNFSTESGAGSDTGKGVIIPSVDLVNFQFDLSLADGFTFPTYFDGMVVYNNASNNTLTNGNRSSTSTAVTPGFYYFSNPNGANNGNVTSGVWKPLGGSSNASVNNITATETATSTSINGKQVYAMTGTFNAVGTAATITVTPPPGMTDYYKMTIFQAGKTFREGITSFNIDPLATVDNVVTGNGMFNEVYPAGTYTYTLEYFK